LGAARVSPGPGVKGSGWQAEQIVEGCVGVDGARLSGGRQEAIYLASHGGRPLLAGSYIFQQTHRKETRH
jgi:hypothetical protein